MIANQYACIICSRQGQARANVRQGFDELEPDGIEHEEDGKHSVLASAGNSEEWTMLTRSLGLAAGLFLGMITSQAPEFGQQYRQRIGGAIDELRDVMQKFDADSATVGLSRPEAIKYMAASQDAFVRSRGASMEVTADRLDGLARQQQAFNQAGKFGRLIALAQQPDPILLRNTYHAFEPSVPLTSEGLVFGGVGFLAGWSAILLGALPFRRRKRRHRVRA